MSDKELLKKAKEVLELYDRWEADLILDGDWSGDVPRMDEKLYLQLFEIQEPRNAILRALRRPDPFHPCCDRSADNMACDCRFSEGGCSDGVP